MLAALAVFVSFHGICGLPVNIHQEVQDAKAEAETFLTRYGYLDNAERNETEQVSEALKTLQMNYGLEPTGEVDNMTRALIETPRCGVKDSQAKRTKRAPLYWRWKHNPVKFYIGNLLEKVFHSTVSNNLDRALREWGQFTPGLYFEQTYTRRLADIELDFMTGADHWRSFCKESWNNSRYAHTFFPDNGTMHFNSDYFDWTDEDLMYRVMLHEVGHVLGLEHDYDENSVMYPTVSPGKKIFSSHHIDLLWRTYPPRRTRACSKEIYVHSLSDDSCFSTWMKHRMSEDEFYELNPSVSCKKLEVGQRLCVA